jgi:hypothetical protein
MIYAADGKKIIEEPITSFLNSVYRVNISE